MGGIDVSAETQLWKFSRTDLIVALSALILRLSTRTYPGVTLNTRTSCRL